MFINQFEVYLSSYRIYIFTRNIKLYVNIFINQLLVVHSKPHRFSILILDSLINPNISTTYQLSFIFMLITNSIIIYH